MKKKLKSKPPSLEKCRKADDYRAGIESFIGQNGTICGEYSRFNTIFNFGFRYNYEMVLLINITATCNGKQEYVQHLWVKLPFGYCTRNKIKKGDTCTFTGSFSEYIKQTETGYRKNIGFHRDNSKIRITEHECKMCMAIV